MDEKTILTLLEAGENKSVDFKRELNLNSAHSKAEFIKDVIAIANSNPSGGYLLVGVTDDKKVIGISKLEEERFQQICHTYITPHVILDCFIKQLNHENSMMSVGIISIRPTIRPHKVAKSIDDIEQDMVFVRRGKITTKSSPEEILSMSHEDNPISREVLSYKKAAETHYKVNNYEDALTAVCKAINLNPDTNLFILRAKIYLALGNSGRKVDTYENLSNAALRDLEYAIKIAESEESIATARRMRWDNFYGEKGYPIELWWEDLRYEIDKMSKIERGEWIFNEVNHWDSIYHGFGEEDFALLAFSLLDEALASGYKNPELLFLVAEAHYYSRNNFEALKFIKLYFETDELSEENKEKGNFLKARILVELGRFSEAKKILRQLKGRVEDNEGGFSGSPLSRENFVDELLYRFALEYELGFNLPYPMHEFTKMLALAKGMELVSFSTPLDKNTLFEFETQLDINEHKFPGLKLALNGILTTSDWAKLISGHDEIVIEVRLTSIDQSANVFIDVGNPHVKDGKRKYHREFVEANRKSLIIRYINPRNFISISVR